ncbi:DUF4160 domain-containing protein [bacterium]|nr:DUF4160 domain-containing protein [bacterium]
MGEIKRNLAGMRICMYGQEEHPLPHIHVFFQQQASTIAIADGRLIVGNLPAGRQKVLRAWIDLHRGELLEMWNSRLKVGGIRKIKD